MRDAVARLGARDFDYLVGAWNISNRRLARRPPVVEILPVFLRAGAICRLRPQGGVSWFVNAAQASRPNRVVKSELRSHNLDARIIHSTSWRHTGECIVLTYLAVLSGPPVSPAGFEMVTVRRTRLARAGAHYAPRSIGVTQVLEHALRHLSWLAEDDPAISDALGSDWVEAVACYPHEPSRALETRNSH